MVVVGAVAASLALMWFLHIVEAYVVVVLDAAAGAALRVLVVAVARCELLVWALFRCKVVESCWIAWW